MVPITFPDVATTTTETSDPTSDTVPATSTASPSTTTTTVTATTAAATITTGGGTVPTAPATPVMVAWAGLRFDGAPTSALLTVTGVAPMSPAATAGIVAGDRITAVGGRSVDTVDALLAEIRRHAPGDVVLLAVLSRPAVTAAANPTAVEHTVSVTLGAVAPIG
ncbi:MAG: PDZ domain-containing protein, partial [Ilumatobacteraceae bacterium]